MNMTLEAKADLARKIRAALLIGNTAKAYRIYNQQWAAGLGPISINLRPGLIHHVLLGQPTGGFLTALLSNDLADAVARADPDSLAGLRGLVRFVRNSTPRLCHGSRAAVKAWRGDGGALAIEYDDADLEGVK